MEQVAQRGGRSPICGNVPDQVGRWGSEQPDLVEDASAHCRGVWARRPLNIPPNPFHNSQTILYKWPVRCCWPTLMGLAGGSASVSTGRARHTYFWWSGQRTNVLILARSASLRNHWECRMKNECS